MSDIAITAANVVPASNAVIDRRYFAGETVSAGQAAYLDPTTNRYMKADSNSATVAARKANGIFVCSASNGQPVAVQTAGDITIGGTLTAGTTYYLSDTPGGICPIADVGTGEYVCVLGVAKSASLFTIGIIFPNVAL